MAYVLTHLNSALLFFTLLCNMLSPISLCSAICSYPPNLCSILSSTLLCNRFLRTDTSAPFHFLPDLPPTMHSDHRLGPFLYDIYDITLFHLGWVGAQVEDVSIRRIRSSQNGINHWNQSNGQGRRVAVDNLNHSKIANINMISPYHQYRTPT